MHLQKFQDEGIRQYETAAQVRLCVLSAMVPIVPVPVVKHQAPAICFMYAW